MPYLYKITGSALDPDISGYYWPAGDYGGNDVYERSDQGYYIWDDGVSYRIISDELGDTSGAYWRRDRTSSLTGEYAAQGDATGPATVAEHADILLAPTIAFREYLATLSSAQAFLGADGLMVGDSVAAARAGIYLEQVPADASPPYMLVAPGLDASGTFESSSIPTVNGSITLAMVADEEGLTATPGTSPYQATSAAEFLGAVGEILLDIMTDNTDAAATGEWPRITEYEIDECGLFDRLDQTDATDQWICYATLTWSNG